MTIAELGHSMHFIICYVQHVMSLSTIKATQRAQNKAEVNSISFTLCFAGSLFLMAGPTGQEYQHKCIRNSGQTMQLSCRCM